MASDDGGRRVGSGIRWRQIPRPPASKQRDPIQGEFFNTDSITTLAKQLTREGIGQNPLDAFTSHPVRVRVFVSGSSGALPPSEAQEYFAGLRAHVEASAGDGGQQAALQFDQPCQFLTIEDFTTTGLRGDPAATDPPESGPNDFFYFFRAEGKSGKSGSDRGRWGVGKYVFPMASQINTFFGLTVRADGSAPGGPGPLLIGQAVLNNHRLEGQSYEPDGWWADFVDDVPVPFTGMDVVSPFRETWSITRRDEPGLSIVIPYVGEDLGPDHLAQAVLLDYYLAILRGKFEVEIASPELPDDILLTADSLNGALEHLTDASDREELRRKIEIARWHMSLADEDFVPVQRVTSGTPKWTPELIQDEHRESVLEALEAGRSVAIRVPVRVEPQDGSSPGQWSHFDVVMAPASGHTETPQFVREGLIVPEVSSPRLSNIRCLVTIDDEGLARMVGDAEGPAHTNWSPRTQKFSGRYRYGQNWLALIKKAPAEILRIVRQEDEEEDRKVLARFFPMPTPEPAPKEPGGQEPEPGAGPTPPPPPPPPPPQPRRIRVGRVVGGFSVHLTGNGPPIERVRVRTAYDRRRGSAMNNWRPEDFDLGHAPIEIEVVGGSIQGINGNALLAEVDDPSQFALHVRGFDQNRDLRVSVTPEESR